MDLCEDLIGSLMEANALSYISRRIYMVCSFRAFGSAGCDQLVVKKELEGGGERVVACNETHTVTTTRN